MVDVELKPCPFCGNGPFYGHYVEKQTIYLSEIKDMSVEDKIKKFGKAAVMLDQPCKKDVYYYKVSCWRCGLTMTEAVGTSITNARTRVFNRWNHREAVE